MQTKSLTIKKLLVGISLYLKKYCDVSIGKLYGPFE